MVAARKSIPKVLPFRTYWWTVTAVTVCGLLISLYLAASHYQVHTDIGYRSFCAISKSLNCDTVSQSAYAILFGVPVAVWGVLGYTGFLLLLGLSACASARPSRTWALLVAVSVAFSAYSAVLAAVSTFRIGSYCIMCMALYAVNFFLLYLTWVVRRRFPAGSFWRSFIEDIRYLLRRKNFAGVPVTAFLAAVIGLLIFFPPYWKFSAAVLPATLPSGINHGGSPWLGAENPSLEIVEFTDYQCFQCRKMFAHLRDLLSQHPDRIRLVHRHFPMDHRFNPLVQEPYHIGSGQMALLAMYAASKGRFWEMHDDLYRLADLGSDIDLRELGAKMNLPPDELAGALKSSDLRRKLSADILFGIQNSIKVTPSYLIEGKVYEGNIPPDILKGVSNR